MNAKIQPIDADEIANENERPTMALTLVHSAPDDDARDDDTPPTEASAPDDTPAPLEQWNDALVRGVATPAMTALLNAPAIFMTGEVWGQNDRRNTKDGSWIAAELTWRAWIEGGPAVGREAAWGFSRHPVGKHKEGSSIVLGNSTLGSRIAKEMEYMYALGLDIDSGAKLDPVLNKIEGLGLFCLAYTTFSDGKAELDLPYDEVLRKLSITREPTLDQVKEYLTKYSDSRYEAEFIDQVTIAHVKKQVKGGVKIILATPAMDKFRLIFPLAERVKLIDLATTQADALRVWEDKITGFARNHLGVALDTSCTDSGRVFFLPRHPQGAVDPACVIVQGEPLRFEDIKPMRKSDYLAERKRGGLNPFEQAGGAGSGSDSLPPQCVSPSGESLNAWHKKYGNRFQLKELMEAVCPDRIRPTGSAPSGQVSVECPYEGHHSTPLGTGCMVGDALDAQHEVWTWYCKHDGCSGRHKLEFLQEALALEWFDESLLTDPDGGYLLEAEDDPDLEEVIEKAVEVRGKVLSLVELFDNNTTDAEVQAVIVEALKNGADIAAQSRLKKEVARLTPINVAGFNKLWKAESRTYEKAKSKTDKASDGAAIVNDWDFKELCHYGQRSMLDANRDNPTIFYYMDALYSLTAAPNRVPRMETLNEKGFGYHLNNSTSYAHAGGENGSTIRGVSAPLDVVVHLFQAPKAVYPALKGQAVAPYFNADGSLVTENGYDPKGQIYLTMPEGLIIPEVAETPTDEEMKRAKDLLIEDVFGDFPLGGKKRAELIEEAGTAAGVPALAHAICMTLQPFVREMIRGDTPIYLIDKPDSGTGAGYLIAASTAIASGRPATPVAIPVQDVEFAKTLTSLLQGMPQDIFFDNPNHAIKSAELCSATTSNGSYQARILGKTALVEVEIKGRWIIAANQFKGSKEVNRRCVLIDLDARTPNPGERKIEWVHDDIRGWVADNRGELIWACLTLVRKWIADGKPLAKDKDLASFEPWSRVMGGILKSAGIGGFLGNLDKLKVDALDVVQSNESALVREMYNKGNGAIFRAGGVSAYKGVATASVKDALNKADDGGPLKLPGWGYDADGVYTSAEKIKPALDRFCARVHELTVEEGGKDVRKIISFQKLECTKNGGHVYILDAQAA